MSAVETPAAHVALIGNPNTGKTTLFNALCGVHQRVGNYPGVTIEKKVGNFVCDGRRYQVLDLPGTYSLAPRAPDEMVAVDVLLSRRDDTPAPDTIVCIVDASNLERNMYLVSQVLELERPVVVALNMVDIAARKGISVDVERLRARLGVHIVAVQAHKKIGVAELKAAIAESVAETQPAVVTAADSPAVVGWKRGGIFPEAFQREVDALHARQRSSVEPSASASAAAAPERVLAGTASPAADVLLPRYLVERLLLDTGGYLDQSVSAFACPHMLAELPHARNRLAAAGHAVPAVEAIARYAWIAQTLDGLVCKQLQVNHHVTDRVDQLLTHRYGGLLVLAAVMMLMFQSVFYIAEPASAAIDIAKGFCATGVSGLVPEGALQSLLVKGVLEGVGSVVVFLPQIFLLFLFIAVLEDCGYMARTAYLMDRLMSQVGLNGKSFIPLLSSFACAIPGIMGARVIEHRRDRLVTILIAPLMSCSARLPVYVLLIAAFIPDRRYLGGLVGLQGLTMTALYAVGVVTAIVVAFVLKKTILKAETPPFVMELPDYKCPSPVVVLHRMLDRGWAFLRRAGTLIFAVAVLVWAVAYYPRDESRLDRQMVNRRVALAEQVAAAAWRPADARQLEQLEAELLAVDHEIESAYLRHSYLGQAGLLVEPVVRPLGWDWKIGCAVIASFPAREIIVATLGVIYTLGDEQDETSISLRDTLRAATWDGTDRPVFTLPVALSIMVFVALCAQCAATLVVIYREAGGWKWPVFTFSYMTILAYVAALLTYQIGTWLQHAGG